MYEPFVGSCWTRISLFLERNVTTDRPPFPDAPRCPSTPSVSPDRALGKIEAIPSSAPFHSSSRKSLSTPRFFGDNPPFAAPHTPSNTMKEQFMMERTPAARFAALALLTALAATPAMAAAPDSTVAKAAADSTAKAPDKPWKVEEDHGPTHTSSFTTDEATWLDLDVSPDGKRIVFSILGDLYVLPIGGGEATRITSGPAYDIQPRFSPYGAWIALTSDRGAAAKRWMCDPPGRKTRA